jgi:hypothetical protein
LPVPNFRKRSLPLPQLTIPCEYGEVTGSKKSVSAAVYPRRLARGGVGVLGGA